MEDLKKVGNKGYPSMLVFAKVIRNIGYDHNTGDEIVEYEKKLRAGFILQESEQFEQYYLVKYFDGSTGFHWGTDLFYRKEENHLTYLKK
jgi:hypothetical protein